MNARTVVLVAASLATVAGITGACGSNRAFDPPSPVELDGSIIQDGAADVPTYEVPPIDAAAGGTPWLGLPGERLGALPPHGGVSSEKFSTSDRCAMCHAAAGGSALRDSKGRDVSPSTLWRSSMMAMAGRDPYWLAAVEHELSAHGTKSAAGHETVMKTCTRCHAPMANVEAQPAALSFAAVTSGTTDLAHLARDGVSCTLCHQVRPDGLGTRASFVGGYVIGNDRAIFGPHASPLTMPMERQVGFTPQQASHVTSSALCGSCHTVITRALDDAGNAAGPEFPEQAPYLEWEASAFAKKGTTCQSCHVPVTDEEEAPIATAISTRPTTVAPRSPFGRHTFVGANAFMLKLLSKEQNRTWAGIATPAAELALAAAGAEKSLSRAAALSISSLTRTSSGVEIVTRVENRSGHKLPTAYPSRRVWLHVRVSDATGATLFESGAHRNGWIVDAAGTPIDLPGVVLPHRDVIDSPNQVQIYEAVARNARGEVATNLLEAVAWAKDTRLLPNGFDRAHPSGAMTAPVGVEGDPAFSDVDEVRYRIAAIKSGARVEIELLYQTTRPAELVDLARAPGAAALRFLDMVDGEALRPSVIASVAATLP